VSEHAALAASPGGDAASASPPRKYRGAVIGLGGVARGSHIPGFMFDAATRSRLEIVATVDDSPSVVPLDGVPQLTSRDDLRLIEDVDFGEGVVVQAFTNLYGCVIGDDTRVGPFVEIQSGVRIGAACKIQSHTFICEGVTIADRCFVGHGVVFVNDNGKASQRPIQTGMTDRQGTPH